MNQFGNILVESDVDLDQIDALHGQGKTIEHLALHDRHELLIGVLGSEQVVASVVFELVRNENLRTGYNLRVIFSGHFDLTGRLSSEFLTSGIIFSPSLMYLVMTTWPIS